MDGFKIEIHFKNVCDKCTDPSRDLKELCGSCQDEMHSDIEDSWSIIHQILDVTYYSIKYFCCRNIGNPPMKRVQ
jgi:hypothetical protein